MRHLAFALLFTLGCAPDPEPESEHEATDSGSGHQDNDPPFQPGEEDSAEEDDGPGPVEPCEGIPGLGLWAVETPPIAGVTPAFLVEGEGSLCGWRCDAEDLEIWVAMGNGCDGERLQPDAENPIVLDGSRPAALCATQVTEFHDLMTWCTITSSRATWGPVELYY